MDNENVAGPSGKGTNAGPPQNENGETTPQTECQVLIGKVPKWVDHDTLASILAKCGRVTELVLEKDLVTHQNSGDAWVTFDTEEAAKSAVKKFGLRVEERSPGVDRKMLYVGNIPSAFTRAEKEDLFASDGLVNCWDSWASYSTEKSQSQMLLYESEAAAANAKEQLALKPVFTSNKMVIEFGQRNPPEEDYSFISDVLIGNVPDEFTDEQIRGFCLSVGPVESVKKVLLWRTAFIRFQKPEDAMEAVKRLDGREIYGKRLGVKQPKTRNTVMMHSLVLQDQRQSLKIVELAIPVHRILVRGIPPSNDKALVIRREFLRWTSSVDRVELYDRRDGSWFVYYANQIHCTRAVRHLSEEDLKLFGLHIVPEIESDEIKRKICLQAFVLTHEKNDPSVTTLMNQITVSGSKVSPSPKKRRRTGEKK